MIWQRYFIRKISTTFAFVLCALFAVYALVDLSVNGVRFFTRGSTFGLDILIYYCLQFAMRLDLFFPLAFLLTTLKTLFDASSHLELVALQTAGLSRKQLLTPFLGFALFLALLGYANHEWVAPYAVKDVLAFKRSKSKKAHHHKTVQSLPLDDGSELVYQTFDGATNEFSDVFWIRSPQDIWAIQSLSFAGEPVGHFANHLVRNSEGLLEKVASFETYSFHDLPTGHMHMPGTIAAFEGRPLSILFRQAYLPSAKQMEARTHLHRKLALPLLPLLAVVSVAPFILTFSRHKKALALVAFSLFGFAVFMTLYDALLLLGENKMTSPLLSMWLPILSAFALFGRRFLKL